VLGDAVNYLAEGTTLKLETYEANRSASIFPRQQI